MIWFACRQCGKTQGRSDEEAGSLIFCHCGASNRVPWENTVEAPPQPVGWVESSEATEAQGADAPRSEGDPIPFADDSPQTRLPKSQRLRKSQQERNAAYCLNHQDVVKQRACVDCGEGFCDDCVVTFQGKVLCGPCKRSEEHT